MLSSVDPSSTTRISSGAGNCPANARMASPTKAPWLKFGTIAERHAESVSKAISGILVWRRRYRGRGSIAAKASQICSGDIRISYCDVGRAHAKVDSLLGKVLNPQHKISLAVAPGARTSFVSGNFNVVHPGHLRLLKFASDLADVLVVGVNPDGAPGVIVPSELRVEGVRALSIVDYVFLMGESVESFLAALQPDFIVKGKEFESKDNPEARVVEEYGGKLVFSSGDVHLAAMDLLREDVFPSGSNPQSHILRSAQGFPDRHGVTSRALHDVIDAMAGMRVAVVGDTIVDEYITCDPLGMSQEDPTVVVSPIDSELFLGGAGIVTAHSCGLGAEAILFTLLGADSSADYARTVADQMNVTLCAFVDETRPTTRKQRFRALNKTLLRVNHFRQHSISKPLAEQMLKSIVEILPRLDLLMFSDFNFGCLPQDLVEAISVAARSQGVLVTADSQASSQISNIARFKGMAMITPTEHEARLALHNATSGLTVLAADLKAAADAENVLLTLGENGMIVHGRVSGHEYMTDVIPALNTTPVDVAGAGDCVFATASMALRTGANVWHASYLGSIAAAIQVSRVGNLPLGAKDIQFEVRAAHHQ